MHYYVTDREGKDWKGRQWGEGVRLREDNPNYHFVTYDNPALALLMDPAYDAFPDPHVWLAEVGDPSPLDFRTASPLLTALRPAQPPTPTVEQRVAFGIVCALNVIADPDFSRWGLAWLGGTDRTPESAERLRAVLSAKDSDEVVAAAQACIASVAAPDSAPEYAAYAASRAYHDAPEPLELSQIATVVMMIPAPEIGKMLGDADAAT